MTDQIRDARRPGYWTADNVIVDVYGPQIGMAGLAVYACLCRHANNVTEDAFPAKRLLMHECGVKTEGPIERGLQSLVEAGLLSIAPRHRENGSQTSNLYTLLNPPCLGAGAEKDTGAGAEKHTPTRAYFRPPLNNPNLTSLNGESLPPLAVSPPVSENTEAPVVERSTKQAPTHGAMFTALAEVCHADKKIMGGRLNRAARALLCAEVPSTPEEIRGYFGTDGIYWREHWKGKKNEFPDPEDVANWMKQAREAVAAQCAVVEAGPKTYGAGRW